jgi:hypothetical protein
VGQGRFWYGKKVKFGAEREGMWKIECTINETRKKKLL